MSPAWHAPRDCKQCGKRFTPKKDGAKMKFCSQSCAVNAQQQQVALANATKREKRIKECGIEDRRHFGDYSLRARDYIKIYPEGHVEGLIALMSAYADLHGYRINPDAHRLDQVIRGLLGRNTRHGLFYCPSRSLTGDPTFDTTIICPCVFLEDEIQYIGNCFCRLFLAKEEVTDDSEHDSVSKTED
jgi:ferredoxin-thioredoxin reductase catalytic subunit/endogenous inhibitor of DNA gyrase (YacG/DUF329 family)